MTTSSILVTTKQKNKRFVARLGVIFANLAVLGVIASVVTVLSFLGILAYYLVLILALFLTLFTLLANPQFMALFDSAENFQAFVEIAVMVAPYVLYASIGCSVLSIVLTSFDKFWPKAKIARVVGIVCLVITSILLTFYLVIGSQISA